jgi:branched-chain amino acid aminotransferase
MHRFILHNDVIRDAGEACLSPGQVGLLSGWGVFSTIRVARGVMFAYERHFARMSRDAQLLRVPFPDDPSWMEERLLRLIEGNAAFDATLRAVVIRNKGGIWQGPTERDFDLIALTSDLSDWGTSVRLGVVDQARQSASRFAGTKVLSWAFNLAMYEEAHCDGFDEVVLLDENGRVSECTSANVFAVSGEQVWTPPLSAGCLPGVTRELLVTGEVSVPDFQVSERNLELSELERVDGVFITSTTRDLLPVESIAGLHIRHDDRACQALGTAFREYIERYVAARTGAAARR